MLNCEKVTFAATVNTGVFGDLFDNLAIDLIAQLWIFKPCTDNETDLMKLSKHRTAIATSTSSGHGFCP